MRYAWLIYGELDQATGGYVYDRLVVLGLRRLGHVVDVVSLEPDACDVPVLANALETGNYDAVIGDELCHPELAELFGLLRERAVTLGPKLVLLVHHLAASEVAATEIAATRSAEPGAASFDHGAADSAVLDRHALVGSAMPASERRVLELAELVITTSRTTVQEVSPWVNAPASVIVPGADRLPRVSRTASGRVRLLFVGTWTPRKGLLRLLGYLEALTELDFELTIVGDEARDPAYAQVVRQTLEGSSWLAARTRVCGVVSDDELASIYASSDVLILPSSYEGYGMVLSEALNAGVFVVAADVGATREVLGGRCIERSRLDGHCVEVARLGAEASRDGFTEERTRAALLPSDEPSAWVHLLRQLVSKGAGAHFDASSSVAPSTGAAVAELPTWSAAVCAWDELLTRACQSE